MTTRVPAPAGETFRLEWECAQLLGRFFRLLDESRYDELATLFGSDGVWHRQGTSLRGSAAVLEAMNARPPHQVTRHLASVPFVELKDDRRALVTAGVTAMGGIRNGDDPLPIKNDGPVRIMDTKLSLLRDGSGRWEISELINSPILEFAPESHGLPR
jgi:hypothetical protein